MLENPESIINLLANSLPAQSNYFIQITLASTFFLQSIEMLRLYPLFLALVRRFVGPRITPNERQQTWGYFNSLEDPPEFWHAETFAQLILFYMVTFVYQPIAPIVCFFLCLCFTIIESGYRYQLIHNYPVKFDTGGRLWQNWIKFTLASMIISQLTLVGLLLLKQNPYAGPAIGPLLALTILFIVYINSKHAMISEFLPTSECVRMDRQYNANGPIDMSFVKNAYLQPSLQKKIVEPDYDEGIDYYNQPSE
jgi:Calcium-dependent channel, 7TM region, putative phosphate